MNSKHLAKGSQYPPLGDKLRIYNMRFCPYAERAVLVAVAKNIPHEIINCDLIQKPEWLLQRNPAGKVPTLELPDGRVLYESLIVSEYLDETFPNPLASNDPYQKAWDKIVVEDYNKVISHFYKIMTAIKNKDDNAVKQNLIDFHASLRPFEEELKKRGTTFFGGKDAGMVDFSMWPWIERVPVIKLSLPTGTFDFEKAKKEYPTLERWRQAMKNHAAIKEVMIGSDMHKEFYDSHLEGKPKYDLLFK